jgi:tetratricopeptide (TPR) repeat protein
MVLNKYLVYMVLVLCLNGCGLLTNNGQQRQQVIPAYTDPDENQAEVIKMHDKRATTSNYPANKSSTAAPIKQKHTHTQAKALPHGSSSTLPYPLIVRRLIERAEKAVKLQQWLSAQHILEKGLHIAPNNAKVFLIYGDVYLNLGILAQAEQMYRRSIALAGDDSLVGRLAKTKLEVLKTGD